MLDHRIRRLGFPKGQHAFEQIGPVLEMPVEAAPARAERGGQRQDADRIDPALFKGAQGGLEPVGSVECFSWATRHARGPLRFVSKSALARITLG